MTQFWTYRQAIDASPTFAEALGNEFVRLGQLSGLTEMAEHLQSGSCQVIFDDPNATFGHSSDAIIGQQRIEVNETACSAPRLYTGFVGVREYRRGDDTRRSLVLGASREISCALQDLNAYASFRVIPNSNRAAIRPRETVAARFSWITSLGYLAFVSNTTYVASNTTMMDKTDYRGQRPVNVLNDCEMAAGFGWNCFIYWNDSTSTPGWFFDNANTSTAFSSTLRISNVLADIDTFTDPAALTFAPSEDAVLRRDPTELADSAYLPYRNGAVLRTRAATTAIYGQKDMVAPNANVSTKARAQALADTFLLQHATEEDRISVTLELPPSKVNLLKAGQRVSVKFSHLPGYESFTWCRVLSRSPAQTRETDDRYEIALELSPQEGSPSSSLVQCKSTVSAAETTVTLDSAVTIGNLLVSRLITRNSEAIPAMFDGTWTLLASGAATGSGGNTHGAVAMYGKIATSTDPVIAREASANQMQMTACEIAGAGLGDVTAFSANHASGGTCNLGSGGGALGLWIIAIPRGTDQLANGYTITPVAGWSVEKNQDIDNGGPCAPAPPDPWWWQAKIENQTTVNISATLAGGLCGGQFIAEWCAAAIFVT